MPQLWGKFENHSLNQDVKIADVSIKDVEAAVKRYFGKLPNGVARLENNQVRLAAR
ncbi:hypothetical protein A0J61_10817, partial [Choanephora cucurbitarum]